MGKMNKAIEPSEYLGGNQNILKHLLFINPLTRSKYKTYNVSRYKKENSQITLFFNSKKSFC